MSAVCLKQYLRVMNTQTASRDYDITLVGATGFAGSLIAEYLARHKAAAGLRIALAGRSKSRLEALRATLPGSFDLEQIDLLEQASVDTLVQKTRVVIAAAGPYSRYGNLLVASCAGHGTHYVDLSGETPWMRRMIQQHEHAARASGACIVHACGYDSIPSDLGVLFLQQVMRERGRGTPDAIRYVPGPTEGGFSGGTVASMLAMLKEAGSDADTRAALRDPDSLTPDAAATSRSRKRRRFDPWLRAWTVPFVMESVNSRIVRRTNALAGHPLGPAPDYREVISFGSGPAGFLKSCLASLGMGAFILLLLFPPTRYLLSLTVLPKQGQGPRAAREGRGRFLVTVSGYRTDDQEPPTRIRVSAERDPGYGATAIMIAEAALLLVDQAEAVRTRPGFQTPATAFGLPLAERLTAAGVKFVRE